MTKVIILGEQPQEEKKLKPIEFVQLMGNGMEWVVSGVNDNPPSRFDEVILIQRNFQYGIFDLFAVKSGSCQYALFLGHFNDGVV